MADTTGPSTDSEPMARMTIRVYSVTREGTITEDRGTVYDGVGGTPLLTSQFPPCSCPRCRARNGQ